MKISFDDFVVFSTGFEGMVTHMYCDMLGLVTCGMGNLIDLYEQPMIGPLVFVHPDGSVATTAEVLVAWRTVKYSDPKMRKTGGNSAYYQGLTTIRATHDSIVALIGIKLTGMENHLKQIFSNWDDLPANCQLACLSMCWGMGSIDAFHLFIAAIKAGDWERAALESHMEGVGIDRRNAANAALLRSCAS